MVIRLRQSIAAILLLAGALTARTGLADAAFGYAGYPYSGFSIQIYSGGPGGYVHYPRHHHHHHHHYWHGHGHHRHFGFPRHAYYPPPRYPYGYYPPGLNINWRGYRCD